MLSNEKKAGLIYASLNEYREEFKALGIIELYPFDDERDIFERNYFTENELLEAIIPLSNKMEQMLREYSNSPAKTKGGKVLRALSKVVSFIGIAKIIGFLKKK